MKHFMVSEKYLDELLDKNSKSLVGKIMKRFEIFDDAKIVKASIKELIYENYRTLKGYITTFDKGVKFKSSPKKQD